MVTPRSELQPRPIGRFDIININAPEATAEAINITYPACKDPVRVFRYPKITGPRNPAVFAIELITPTAAAAAEALNVSVGIDQNTGRNASSSASTL